MRSAQRSAPEVLAGPVAVCIDRPLLSLDRAFTYDLPAELGAGVGSLVRFRFHGSLTKGWVLGPTDDVPPRMLAVQKAVSPERFFDERMLELARWVSERYVAPLAAVLRRLAPPRVAGEEAQPIEPGPADARGSRPEVTRLPGYEGGEELLDLCRRGSGARTLRPSPADEQIVAVDAVAACLEGGRRALVLIPEATPLPATAVALREAFGEEVAVFAGGDARARFRAWRAIQAGVPRVVVGTRPAVFAPLPDLGLIYLSRESHPAHREDRAPYSHVRDVAIERARRGGAAVVLQAICPSVEASSLGLGAVAPRARAWPKVEVVRPGPGGRSPRLAETLRQARRAFVFAPVPGSGTAQVCRSCGAAAACAACGGMLREEAGEVRCVVCAALGRCSVCGADRFAIRPGGAERLAAWAARVAMVPVHEVLRPRLPREREILVGGPEVVRDLGSGDLDLVAIVEADASARRPGLDGPQRTLTTWMEAAAWAGGLGRVVIQATNAGDPMIQALVRGNPDRFAARERKRRAEAGFPVGSGVFRVVGDASLTETIAGFGAHTTLVSTIGERTVCLLALAPDRIASFGVAMRRLAASGAVERVEAEPHL